MQFYCYVGLYPGNSAAAEWSVILTRNREVRDSDPRPNTGYSEVLPVKCQNNSLNYATIASFTTFPIHIH